MTNDEFQKLVLEKLVSLEQGQSILGHGQKSLELRQGNLEQGQKSLELRQGNLEQGQKSLELRQGNLEQGQKSLELRQGNLEQGQKSLEAKMEKGFNDVIAMVTVTQKEVESLRRDLRTLEVITSKNWNDIVELKQAK